jgi:hypothetical protein
MQRTFRIFQEPSVTKPCITYEHPSYSECEMETQAAPPKEDYHTVSLISLIRGC